VSKRIEINVMFYYSVKKLSLSARGIRPSKLNAKTQGCMYANNERDH
jgi:hypothetical protein